MPATSVQPARRTARLLLAFAIGILATNVSVQPAQATGGDTFVSLANQKRALEGKPPVALSAIVDQISVERGNQMAAADAMVHDLPYVQRRLSQLGACYSSVGEIIAWESGYSSHSYQRTIDAWWASSGHHAIMVGDYNAAGGSWSVSTSRKTYSVMIFVRLCSAPAPAPTPAPTPPPPPPSSPTTQVSRLAGVDRYATAAAVSAASFGAGVSVAYVATGANFPDALAGGSAAAQAGGPVLLVQRDGIPAPTAAELIRLRPGRIVILGSTGVVSDGLAAQLRSFSGDVRRIAGVDRYATAAAISQAHFAPGVPVVYIATGTNFPDALAGGAVAGRDHGPVLLVAGNQIPSATVNELGRLRPGRIVVLGSNAVVSDGVAASLNNFTGGGVSRMAGGDRYATAIAISRASYGNNQPGTVFVAAGGNFPDGLAASPVAGRLPGPLLLVPTSSLPGSVADELRRLAPDRVVILGGSAVVSDGVSAAIRAALP